MDPLRETDMSSTDDPRVIFILGATASGKTALAISLAKCLGSAVISADAFQVYRDFGVASDKVTSEQMQGVPHYGMDLADPTEEFSVKQFLEYAVPVIDRELMLGRSPIIVGGTNMYIEKLLFTSTLDEEASSLSPLSTTTLPPLFTHEDLARVDPEMAARLHPNDSRRIGKALEYYYATGVRKSDSLATQQRYLRWPNTLVLVKYLQNKEALHGNIRIRIMEKMVAGDRLKEELRRIKEKVVSGRLHWGKGMLQAIGYREFEPYVEALCTDQESANDLFNEGIEKTVRDTVSYAKKQLTWIRKIERNLVIHPVSDTAAIAAILSSTRNTLQLKTLPKW